MGKTLIGKGIFGWCSTERRTQRYGSIHLAGPVLPRTARPTREVPDEGT